jgi:hypothetical protein
MRRLGCARCADAVAGIEAADEAEAEAATGDVMADTLREAWRNRNEEQEDREAHMNNTSYLVSEWNP